MDGKKTNVGTYLEYETGAKCMTEMNISIGGISKGNYKPENPYGVGEMRGYGAVYRDWEKWVNELRRTHCSYSGLY